MRRSARRGRQPGSGLRFDEDDVHAAGPEACGEFAADESGPDDHRALCGAEVLAQSGGIVVGAQHVDAAGLREAGNAPGPQSGGDDEPVVAERAAVAERDLPGAGVDAGGGHAEPQADAHFLEEFGGPQGGVVELAANELFGQRRPVVGCAVFVAEEGQFPFVTCVSQFLGGSQAGQSRANN